MAFPTIPLPSVWDIPVAAGVPALLGQSIGAGVSASASTLLGQAVSSWLTGLASTQWGIYKGTTQILTAAHVCGIEHEQRYQISTAPTENGGFVSYNKVKLPHLTRILMVCDGSETGSILSGGLKQVLGSITGSAPLTVRKSFFDTLESLVTDRNLYDIHMPEKAYWNANIVAYRFRRDEREGVTMPVVEIELQEVRNTAVTSYANNSSRSVSAAIPVQSGRVDIQQLPSGAPDLTGGLLTGGK